MSKKESFVGLSKDELSNKIDVIRDDLFWLNFKNKSGQDINASDIRSARKNLARALTQLNVKAQKN